MTSTVIGEGGRTASSALTARGLSKQFFGASALDDVSIELRPGRVMGLVGENGSGKSTLVKILTGVYTADGGEIVTPEGRFEARRWTPASARQCGIRVVHQNAPTFGALSVAENLFVGGRFPTHLAGGISGRRLRSQAKELLERYDLPVHPDELCRDLSPAFQCMIAIVRALATESGPSSLLILDEPTAALSDKEVSGLLRSITGIAEQGSAILYISHRLAEIHTVCDEVTVLRDGRLIAERPVATTSHDELVELIVGRGLSAPGSGIGSAPEAVDARPRLSIRSVSVGPLRDFSIDIAPGEVIGVAGLIGSGRTELLLSLFGAHAYEGEVLLDGEHLRASDPRAAIERGIRLVPENRLTEAVFAPLAVQENLLASDRDKFWSRLRFDRGSESEFVQRSLTEFGVVPRDPQAAIIGLSGGNQQKVVLSRALVERPKVLLLDEPTQGVDVGAREEIHRHIHRAASEGTTVVVVSSDFEELAMLCHRAVVIAGGQIVDTLERDRLNPERLTALALSHPSSTSSQGGSK